ncbi:MAG: DUF2723 domain-containing protein [Bacteroidia bacterium]|nr:DUF2723 domain-containing protein [Bacteroidia bacterium]
MNFKRINNLAGWLVFLVAAGVYLRTMAPTASFWDCGEFIACSNELEVPHPPGAPFFLLLGRIFAMMAGSDVTQVAFMLNILSVLASAFTVLFTFWITTHLGRRLLELQVDASPSLSQSVAIIGAGVVGALACAFADSFWFNAVEAEVYALSSFFTAIVVWLMFKWEDRADEPGHERWIILIAYLMGLSMGVHLLNLLAIPALAFVYYFRKYPYSWQGLLVTTLVSIGILAVIQTGIIVYTFDLAWAFEKFFTGIQGLNGTAKGGLGLPSGLGVAFFFLLFFGALAWGVYYSAKNKMALLNTTLICTAVIYIGFASYLMVPIRSNANPAIDENNPGNAQSFLSYMKREQYGNRPLLYGPLYNAQPSGYKDNGKEYAMEPGQKRYTELGDKVEYEYAAKDQKLFPRMYEKSRYNAGPYAYVNYVRRKGDPNNPNDDKPTGGEDLAFFWDYQVRHMYLRYFMWNFAGRESDNQDAEWESGLNFSTASNMPAAVQNKGRNHYFMIPLLLGFLGLGWQIARRPNDATVVGLLFLFTGLAIIVYLNQYPAQPRERDYSFAGSFQTFAIWVGLGVIALYQLLEKYLKGISAYLATAVGLIAPALMIAQNWDDHTRADNYVAPDSAYNLLNSLAPNAVLFTNGDNDTFPLWYIQEVEGVRTDVRVLCLSYVNTDWYIDQMYQQVNQSPPLPLTLKRREYVGQANQAKNYGNRNTINKALEVNKAALIQSGLIAAADSANIPAVMRWQVSTRGGQGQKYLELKDELILNLLDNVAKGNWERPVYFANTVAPNSFLNMENFLHQEGLAYRILPLVKPAQPDLYDPMSRIHVDLDKSYKLLTETFKYRNLNRTDIYYDENIIRMLSNYHSTTYRVADAFLDMADSLKRVPDTALAAAYQAKALSLMQFSQEKFPYAVAPPDPYYIIRGGMIYERMGMLPEADAYYDFAEKRTLETLQYYADTKIFFPREREWSVSLQILLQHYSQMGRQDRANALQERMMLANPNMLRQR